MLVDYAADALLRILSQNSLLHDRLDWVPICFSKEQDEELSSRFVLYAQENFIADLVIHKITPFPSQQDQVENCFLTLRITLNTVAEEALLKVKHYLVIELGDQLAQRVTHDLELSHDCAIVEASHLEVSQIVFCDLAS